MAWLRSWGFWKAIVIVAIAYFLLFVLPNLFVYWATPKYGQSWTPLSAHRVIVGSSSATLKAKIDQYGVRHGAKVDVEEFDDGAVGGFVYTQHCLVQIYRFEPKAYQVHFSGRDPQPASCEGEQPLRILREMLGAKTCPTVKAQHLGDEVLYDHRDCPPST